MHEIGQKAFCIRYFPSEAIFRLFFYWWAMRIMHWIGPVIVNIPPPILIPLTSHAHIQLKSTGNQRQTQTNKKRTRIQLKNHEIYRSFGMDRADKPRRSTNKNKIINKLELTIATIAFQFFIIRLIHSMIQWLRSSAPIICSLLTNNKKKTRKTIRQIRETSDHRRRITRSIRHGHRFINMLWWHIGLIDSQPCATRPTMTSHHPLTGSSLFFAVTLCYPEFSAPSKKNSFLQQPLLNKLTISLFNQHIKSKKLELTTAINICILWMNKVRNCLVEAPEKASLIPSSPHMFRVATAIFSVEFIKIANEVVFSALWNCIVFEYVRLPTMAMAGNGRPNFDIAAVKFP